MPGVDATEVRSALRTDLYVAPVGTAMPADPVVALAADWVHLGHHDFESILTLNQETDREEIRSALSYYPVRIDELSRTLTSTFTVIQRNAVTMKLAFGGGTIVTTEAAVGPPAIPEFHTFTPPQVGTIDERAFIWHVTDGAIVDRYLLYRGLPLLASEIEFARGTPTKFGLEVAHMESADGDVWKHMTTDPAMEESD